MATISVTNRIASQSIRGQNVKITLDASDAANLSQFSVGMECRNGVSDFVGYIYSIDTYGNSFEISPAQPNLNMSDNDNPSGSFGYFNAGVGVTVTIS